MKVPRDLSGDDLAKALKRLGYQATRQTGAHLMWWVIGRGHTTVFGPWFSCNTLKQWEEGNVAPKVVCEVLSPGNHLGEMVAKRQFYEKYGVEEYYIYDADDGSLEGWLREGGRLKTRLRCVSCRPFEKLKGARSSDYSIRLNDQFRLTFQIEKADGGNRLVILDIEDYH